MYSAHMKTLKMLISDMDIGDRIKFNSDTNIYEILQKNDKNIIMKHLQTNDVYV